MSHVFSISFPPRRWNILDRFALPDFFFPENFPGGQNPISQQGWS